MSVRKILPILLTTVILVNAKWHNLKKREVPSICSPIYNKANKVQCYCVEVVRETNVIKSADCYMTAENVLESDSCWDGFNVLKALNSLNFANTRGIRLKYFPSKALKHTQELQRLDVKYGNIETIQPYSFANLSSLQHITIRDSQIRNLAVHAFAHHKDLMVINLDRNNIVEINRDVFMDLPSLEKLYLTSNKLTTIHDRAFIHLNNLKEFDLNMNMLFSLNSETFSGLKKLLKLDLSGNSLEVIGDNTFTPLKNLETLNLDGNKIQMLDEKAFNSLVNLRHLNLAHNKLSTIENEKTFEGLKSLVSLSLRANEIRELKPKVMAPIRDNLFNAYDNADANLDIEDNIFPCDCRLDWFMTLINRTVSKRLNNDMENFKCIPESKTREDWMKLEETNRNNGQSIDEGGNTDNGDYEYYDESQLNGKLFYTDVRFLLNCSKEMPSFPSKGFEQKINPKSTTKKNEVISVTTQASKPKEVTSSQSTMITSPIKEKPNVIITNQKTLDLSKYETTVKSVDDNSTKYEVRNRTKNDKATVTFTTTRIATVSAKPVEKKHIYEDKMASDEAIPGENKAHRSIKEELKSNELKSSAVKNISSLLLIVASVMYILESKIYIRW